MLFYISVTCYQKNEILEIEHSGKSLNFNGIFVKNWIACIVNGKLVSSLTCNNNEDLIDVHSCVDFHRSMSSFAYQLS